MEIEERIYRGNRAKEVLENEVFIEAFDTLEKEIIKLWQESPARDQEGREKLFQLMGLTHKLKGIITSTMETGKLASAELNHKQSLYDQAKAYLGEIW